MANKRFEQLGFQPFRPRPLMPEGLLAVAREGGDLERRVANALFSLADVAGERADAQAAKAGMMAGQRDALAGRTRSTFAAEPGIDPQLTGAIAPAKGGIADTIRQVAKQEGVDPETMVAIAQIESGLNPDAKNPNSSAAGLFQFIDGTAKQYGLANKFDPVQATRAAAKLAKDNAAHLTKVLGRAPTPGELYLAHQQGPGGAAKLLANPNARAADVVGMAAVRLNGGNGSMTALEFAQQWTRKVSGAKTKVQSQTPIYTGQVNPDGTIGTVAKPGVDPVQTGATAAVVEPDAGIALTGGTFRPSGRDTVYGRAYDKAGVSTYLNMLDAEVASTTAQVYRKFKDDPAKLGEALDSLRRDMLANHVFPEIAGDFEVAFVRKTGAYLDAAYDEAQTRAKEAERAEFMQRTQQLENGQQQAIAAMDPASPNVADEISRQQQGIDAHYDEAVARGIMAADDAEKAKVASRRTAALDFYKRQAEGRSADDLKTMREAMKADFADGGIDGLDAEGWQALEDGLSAAERSKRLDEEQAQKAVIENGEVFAMRVASGLEINKDEWAKYRADGAAVPASLAETEAKIAAARSIRDLPLDEAAKRIDQMRKDAGNAPDSAQLRTIGFAEKMLADKAKALRTDPLTHAETMKLIAPSGNLADAAQAGADSVGAVMLQRARDAEKVEAEYGVPVKLLKPGEAKTINDIAKADPAKGAQLAGALIEGAGPRAAAVLAELGDTAPLMAGAGMIIAAGGNPAAAEDALAGQSRDIKVKIKPALTQAAWRAMTGGALDMQPADGKRIMATALSIARKRMDDAGAEPDSDEGEAIYRQAVQEAAGATMQGGVQFGGFTTLDLGAGWFDGKSASTVAVMVPPSIRADLFDDVLGAVSDADLTGAKPKGGAGRLRDLVPVAVKGGYVFSDGDAENPSYLPDESGKVFVLDLESLGGKLAARVPGAFK